MEEDFPPGFRFFPTEEELVGYYLHNKLEGQSNSAIDRVIPAVDINGVEPWNLPTLAGEVCRGDKEQWFFFSPGQEREARGGRPNRLTACGYWKATGSPGYVYSSDNKVIGVKKNMVFYVGKAPIGKKTKWKMNEYRAIQLSSHSNSTTTRQLRREFSLCRVYVVSGTFRAFDRRPLEEGRGGLRGVNDGTDQSQFATCTQAAAAAGMDGSSSFDYSQIGGRHHNTSTAPAAGCSSSTDWNVNNSYNNNNNNNNNNNDPGNEVPLQEPSWEWDFDEQHFDWL